MHVLVVNVGSSSLKLRFLDDRDQVVKSADLPVWVPDINDRDPSRTLRDWPPPNVVGHRVGMAAPRFYRAGPGGSGSGERAAGTDRPPAVAPTEILGGLRSGRAMLPEVAAVACYDTAFYASMPAEAATYAVPREWQRRYGCAGTASTGYRTPPRLRHMEPESDPPPDPFRIARCAWHCSPACRDRAVSGTGGLGE